jgi:hypothetical protein
MTMTNKGFCVDGYAIGIDEGRFGGDESIVALVKLGEQGEPDELITTLTWEQAKLVARAIQEYEPKS